MSCPAIGVDVRQTRAPGHCKRENQQNRESLRWAGSFRSTSASEQEGDSQEKQDPSGIADGELTKKVLKNSEGVAEQKCHIVIVSRVEIRAPQEEFAHPALEGGSRFAYTEL